MSAYDVVSSAIRDATRAPISPGAAVVHSAVDERLEALFAVCIGKRLTYERLTA